MAVSGFVWVGFLLAHLGTNAHLFGGPDSLNEYYAGLKSNAFLLWGVRSVLAVTLVAHVTAAVMLTRRKSAARSIGYREQRHRSSTFAGRNMAWTGLVLGAFILYHLAHFTTGQAMPPGTTFVHGDEFGNIVSSFSIWYIAAIYIFCLVLLGMHLFHGATAATLSLGVRHPRYDNIVRRVLGGLVAALVIGMLSMPIAVLFGWIH